MLDEDPPSFAGRHRALGDAHPERPAKAPAEQILPERPVTFGLAHLAGTAVVLGFDELALRTQIRIQLELRADTFCRRSADGVFELDVRQTDDVPTGIFCNHLGRRSREDGEIVDGPFFSNDVTRLEEGNVRHRPNQVAGVIWRTR